MSLTHLAGALPDLSMKSFLSLAVLIVLNSCCAFRSTCDEPVAVAAAAAPAAPQSDLGYKVIPLRYAVADELAQALRNSLVAQPGRPTPRVVAEERTNSVIISCSPDELPPIEKLISELDVEVKKSK